MERMHGVAVQRWRASLHAFKTPTAGLKYCQVSRYRTTLAAARRRKGRFFHKCPNDCTINTDVVEMSQEIFVSDSDRAESLPHSSIFWSPPQGIFAFEPLHPSNGRNAK